MQQLTMPDGRSLDVVAEGPAGAPTLVFHHGTPWAADDSPPWVAAAVSAGLRWVSFSRPGYGLSTRRPGRSVADVVTDVAAVLDQLDVSRFVSIGWSGGGPHALACGAQLAPRCAGVVLLAGVAPHDVMADAGLDWFDGMGPENHEEFGAAFAGEDTLRAFLEPLRPEMIGLTGDDVIESLGGLIDQADKAVLSGEYADRVAARFAEAMRVGVDGWVDDDLAFARAWGFELSDVDVPVGVWQGEDDRMVPFAHGPFQAARLPDVRTHLLAGEGHLSIPLGRFDEIVAEAASFL